MDWISIGRPALQLASFIGALYAGLVAARALVTGRATTRAVGQPARTISLMSQPTSFLLHLIFHAAAAAAFLALGLVLRSDTPPEWMTTLLQALSTQ